MIKLFLDDERAPPNDGNNWHIVRNFSEFKNHIDKNGLPEFISFDHDLGSDFRTGFHCARYLIEYCLDNKLNFNNFDYYVHSQNPIGKANIIGLVENAKGYL